ncbi:MAG: GNAT family N-acetyltransferase [Pseudomonadota bacterium]
MSENHPGEGEETRLRLRNLTAEDYPDIKAAMDAVYPGIGGAWTRKEYMAQINRFPEGQIGIEDNGRVVAAAFAVIVDFEDIGDQHTYEDIIAGARFTTHDPNGDVLYGVDVFVHPEYRGMRLGRRLYDARKELCQQLNLRAIIAGGRIPGYGRVADEMGPHEYIEKVRHRELHDPILSFQLANDFQVKRVLKGYLPEDEESRGYATLLQWNNFYYEPREKPLFGGTKDVARLGLLQWQMRATDSLEDMLGQVEFFVDAMAAYEADFVVFPELFNLPLMALVEQHHPAEAIRALADYTGPLVEAIQKMAVSYNTNIIAGSMPEMVDGRLHNVSWLCLRDGTSHSQHKLHITPQEAKDWALEGGDVLRVFDTDVGRIGILVCYDVEFPELGRTLSEQGVQILFVPFWTDTRNAYLRVRHCAQARAIENECYVAITGSVGNLPNVENVDIQYAQSAVFSPCDFAFPQDGIIAESSPNTEMTLVVDVELEKLKQLRNEGTVRNYRDRRLDLYRVSWLNENPKP